MPGGERSHCHGPRWAPAGCVQGTERRLERDQNDGGRACGAVAQGGFPPGEIQMSWMLDSVAVVAESRTHHRGARAEMVVR